MAHGRRGTTAPQTIHHSGDDLRIDFEVSGPARFVALFQLADEEPYAFADGTKQARLGPRQVDGDAFRTFAGEVTLVRHGEGQQAAVTLFLKLASVDDRDRPGERFFRSRWVIPILGNAVTGFRARHRLTYAEVARMADLSPSTIRRIEHGTRPSTRTRGRVEGLLEKHGELPGKAS